MKLIDANEFIFFFISFHLTNKLCVNVMIYILHFTRSELSRLLVWHLSVMSTTCWTSMSLAERSTSSTRKTSAASVLLFTQVGSF